MCNAMRTAKPGYHIQLLKFQSAKFKRKWRPKRVNFQ
jgi:hypothetical protein